MEVNMAEETVNSSDYSWDTSKGKTVSSSYESILKTLMPQTIGYSPIETEKQTQESLASQISAYLRPYVDKSIADRKSTTTANRAGIDIDAASRGMGASTWVTDAKQRETNAEASDIAGLESDYAANLAEQVYNSYQSYLDRQYNVDTANAGNQIEVDEFNAQVLAALEQTAYERALDMNSLKGRGSGSGSGTGSPLDDLLKSLGFSTLEELYDALEGGKNTDIPPKKNSASSSHYINKPSNAVMEIM
jgi:hypothetical protein